MTIPEDAACGHALFDASARAKALAPFVEEETAIVVRVDLCRIAVQPTIDLLCQVLLDAPIDFRNGVVAKRLGEILSAGVSEFYAVTSSPGTRTPSRMYYLIPLPTSSDEKAVRTALHIPNGLGQVIEGVLLIHLPRPSSRGEEQPRAFQPADRPELTAAFEAAGDTAVQVVLIPPADARRVIEEFMPQLPESLGNGPSTVLTHGLLWAAVGVDSPPQGSLRLVIQSTDAQAAESLRLKLADLLRLAGERKGICEQRPKFDEAAALLAPTVEGDQLVLTLDQQNQGFERLVSALTPTIEVVLTVRGRIESAQNLKHIALAMHNYYQGNKHFPLVASASRDGKPLLSWRVHILPYLDQDSLFKQVHLDEPWDSPHNRTLIDKMPAVYRHPFSQADSGRTNYLLPVGNGAAFSADMPTTFRDIRDGTSYTIMVVEVDDQQAAIWTKPDDWAFDPEDPTRGLGRFYPSDPMAAFFDGSVQPLHWPQTPDDLHRLRALVTCADGEVVAR